MESNYPYILHQESGKGSLEIVDIVGGGYETLNYKGDFSHALPNGNGTLVYTTGTTRMTVTLKGDFIHGKPDPDCDFEITVNYGGKTRELSSKLVVEHHRHIDLTDISNLLDFYVLGNFRLTSLGNAELNDKLVSQSAGRSIRSRKNSKKNRRVNSRR